MNAISSPKIHPSASSSRTPASAFTEATDVIVSSTIHPFTPSSETPASTPTEITNNVASPEIPSSTSLSGTPLSTSAEMNVASPESLQESHYFSGFHVGILKISSNPKLTLRILAHIGPNQVDR